MDPGVRRDDERTCRRVEDAQDQGPPPPPLGQPAKGKKRKY